MVQTPHRSGKQQSVAAVVDLQTFHHQRVVQVRLAVLVAVAAARGALADKQPVAVLPVLQDKVTLVVTDCHSQVTLHLVAVVAQVLQELLQVQQLRAQAARVLVQVYLVQQ